MIDKRACAGQGRVCISAMYLFLSICVHDDMEIETVYTDTYLKTTSPKNDRGLRSENRLREHAAGGRYIFVYMIRHPHPRHLLAEGTENRGGMAAASRMHGATTKDLASLIMGVGVGAGNAAGRERARSTTFDTHLSEGIYLRSLPDQRGTIADGGQMTW